MKPDLYRLKKIFVAVIMLTVLFRIPAAMCQGEKRQSILGTHFSIVVPDGFTYYPSAYILLSNDSACGIFFHEVDSSRLSHIRNSDVNNSKSKTIEITSLKKPKISGMEALFIKCYYRDSALVRRNSARQLTVSDGIISLEAFGSCPVDRPEYLGKIDTCFLSLRLSREEFFDNGAFAEFVRIPTTGTALIPPPDFRLMKDFTGLRNESANASIIVVEMPAPIAVLQKGLTPEQMLVKGVKITRYEPEIPLRPNTMLMEGEQTDQNTVYRKLICVFGDEYRSSMVMGMYPIEKDGEMYQPMMQSIMSAVYAPFLEEKTLVEDYILNELEPDFILRTNTLGAQVFGLKDSVDTATVFITTKSMKPVTTTNYRQEAINRVKLLPHPESITIDSVNAVTIDGLHGYEVLAHGKDNEGVGISIYSTMLFLEDRYYYILSGRTKREAQAMINLFRPLAFSFSRK